MGVKNRRKILCLLVALAVAAGGCASEPPRQTAKQEETAGTAGTTAPETIPQSGSTEAEGETKKKGLIPGLFGTDDPSEAEPTAVPDKDFFDEPDGTAGAESSDGSETGESTPEGNEEGGFSPIWLIGIAVAAVAVLAAVLGIRASRRRGRPEESGPQQEPTGALPRTGEPAREGVPPQAPPLKEAGGMWIGNAHHIGARQNQQDSFAISDVTNQRLCREKGVFAVVADGMGGLSNGAQISAMVTSVMLTRFEGSPAPQEIPAELLEMVHQANGEVNGYLGHAVGQSGSTVVAVWISQMRLHFISVGDSRIYLVRGATLTQLNREHTYASELDEQAARGTISWEEARSDPQRHALTSYIGMGELEQIDRSLHPLPLIAGDRVLLMTDGVFGTLSEQEILEAVNGNAMEAARRIEEKVLEKRKPTQDNFTAVILQWN